MPMITTTMSSSMSVKPRREDRIGRRPGIRVRWWEWHFITTLLRTSGAPQWQRQVPPLLFGNAHLLDQRLQDQRRPIYAGIKRLLAVDLQRMPQAARVRLP